MNSNEYLILEENNHLRIDKNIDYINGFISQILYSIIYALIKMFNIWFKNIFSINSFLLWENIPILIYDFFFIKKISNIKWKSIGVKHKILFYIRILINFGEEYFLIKIINCLRLSTQTIMYIIFLFVAEFLTIIISKKFYFRYFIGISICFYVLIKFFENELRIINKSNWINHSLIFGFFVIINSLLKDYLYSSKLYFFDDYLNLYNLIFAFILCFFFNNYNFENIYYILFAILIGLLNYLAYYFKKRNILNLNLSQSLPLINMRIPISFIFSHFLYNELIFLSEILQAIIIIIIIILIHYYNVLIKKIFNNINRENIYTKNIVINNSELNSEINNNYIYLSIKNANYLKNEKENNLILEDKNANKRLKQCSSVESLNKKSTNHHSKLANNLIKNEEDSNIINNNEKFIIEQTNYQKFVHYEEETKNKIEKEYIESLGMKNEDKIINNLNNNNNFLLDDNSKETESKVFIEFNIDEKLDEQKDKKEIYLFIFDLSNIKPRGLINLGSTCFMNSVLQSFFHVKKLSQYFIQEIEKDKNKFIDCPLTNAYISVILGLINKNNDKIAFKPIEFNKELIEINNSYDNYKGSDPKDVVYDFIHKIHREINGDNSIQLNNKLNQLDKLKMFYYYKEQEEETESIISLLFGWCQQIEKYCEKCKIKSYNFNYEFFITFNLEAIYSDLMKAKINKERELNLKECFNNYFGKKNKLFTCPACKTRMKGIVSNKICVLPNYFIIILNRGKNDKFNCKVNFDYILDIEDITEQIESKKVNTKYELIAATFLYGPSGEGGHTVAFCKHFDNNYYLYNDSTYSKKKLEQLKNNKAFLLYYERIEK